MSVCGIIHRNVSLFKHSIKKKETKTSKWVEETDSFHLFSSSPLCPLGGVEVHAKKRTKDLMKPLNNDLHECFYAYFTNWEGLCQWKWTSTDTVQFEQREKENMYACAVCTNTLCSLMLDASCFQDLLGNWAQMIQVLLINWHAIIKSSQ